MFCGGGLTVSVVCVGIPPCKPCLSVLQVKMSSTFPVDDFPAGTASAFQVLYTDHQLGSVEQLPVFSGMFPLLSLPFSLPEAPITVQGRHRQCVICGTQSHCSSFQ